MLINSWNNILFIPRLTGRQSREKFGDKPKDIGGFDHPWVFAVLKGCQVSPLSPLQNVCFYFENERNTVYRGDQNGNLSIWHLPKQCDPLIEEYLRTKRPVLYEANASQSMQSLWNLMSNNTPPSISEVEEGKQITSSLYIHHQGNLVLGREDGSIVLRYSIHALMRQLLDFNTPESRKTRILHGHYTAVTALLYPHDECSRYDTSILVSGGNDFSVIVWNIYTGTKVHRFNVQGGPILKLMITPNNATKKVQNCICSIAKDNSVALLSLKDNSCLVLASRQLTPIVDVKFRPLDDFMLVKCEDTSIFVWQMETGNLERIITGLYVDEIMDACDEQIGLYDVNDSAGAAQAVQLLRAIKNKNLNVVKKFVTQNERESDDHDLEEINVPPPIKIQQLKKISNDAYMIIIDLQSLIMGLLAMDKEFNKTKKKENTNESTEITPIQKRISLGSNKGSGTNKKFDTSLENFNVYIDTANLLISLLHAWNVDLDLDEKIISTLNLHKPKYPINYGIISRNHSFVSLYLPMAGPKVLKSQPIPAELMSFTTFSKQVHWHLSSSITTLHLLSIIAISNTIMSMKDSTLKHASAPILTRRRGSVICQLPSNKTSELVNDTEIRNKKQVWSLILSLHCVSLYDMIEHKKDFCHPRIELLARKWQDSCIEIREAAQTLLIRELKQLKTKGREELITAWSLFLPSNVDKKNSIFSLSRNCSTSMSGSIGTFVSSKPLATEMIVPPTSRVPPVRPPPPIPPRPNISAKNNVNDTESILKERNITLPSIKTCEGLQQFYKNQASAIVILGVIGAHFSTDLSFHPDLARAASHSLLELLIASPSPLLPIETPLRRAAIDLLGKGFTVWQPHLDISKVLLGLLELASSGENTEDTIPGSPTFPLTPAADACRTAKHALSLIASVRPHALILALSTEVARFNSATQHQTIQQSFVSPLVKANVEILRIIEQLTEKQYNDIIDLIIPVGDILVHCLEPPILKTTPLVKLFPPIAKFHMVAYCAQSRRIGFGGKNGKIVIHDLKTSKTLSIQAHNQPITAIDFSPDGKVLAVYCATEAKISLWQSQQSFLGMGPGQVKCIKSMNAPAEFPIQNPGETLQIFKAKLVFNGSKALTLVLPNGKESRFTLT
ncbi:Rabconnectin-3B [Strongyloides ratti]|uniref:Rabconnectin-3B n=1 Tax=Strongyloides ratti TaxID=34506 RepID=A0A090L4C0_STRRB|nr:Rabconnectin-3B [Strongyloides ratti]CEF62967.1 Rabconnectin-3B [Strongyloides ratti]